MTAFTVIHGPPASGKTYHSKAFRRLYHCHASADLDDLTKLPRRFQTDGLLIFTTLPPDDAEEAIRKVVWDADLRFIDISTARQAIGVAPYARIHFGRATH